MKNIVICENNEIDKLYPFSIMHCSWEMRVGALKLYEKIEKNPELSRVNKYYYSSREDHLNSFCAKYGKVKTKKNLSESLFLDGSFIFDYNIMHFIKSKINNKNIIFSNSDGDIIAKYVHKDIDIINLDHVEAEEEYTIKYINKIKYLFDCLDYVEQEINNDLKLLNIENYDKDIKGVHFVNKENVYLADHVFVLPGTVIDASEGPVIIDSHTRIFPNSTIIGPVYIGKHNQIKAGAKIYENNSFGEWCKVGGEVENSIIHSYSNKQHEGFLGHSYLCEWVNLGADTNTSDLKNTYSNIKIRLKDEQVDTGRMFLGLLCGDHTKSSINAMFTTGTVAGVCGILVRDWFLPNYIESFSWGGKADSPRYKLSKAIETAKIVMARRNKELLPEEIKLFELEYNVD